MRQGKSTIHFQKKQNKFEDASDRQHNITLDVDFWKNQREGVTSCAQIHQNQDNQISSQSESTTLYELCWDFSFALYHQPKSLYLFAMFGAGGHDIYAGRVDAAVT